MNKFSPYEVYFMGIIDQIETQYKEGVTSSMLYGIRIQLPQTFIASQREMKHGKCLSVSRPGLQLHLSPFAWDCIGSRRSSRGIPNGSFSLGNSKKIV